MPSARRQAFFAYFLSPFEQKVWRLAGRNPPVLPLFLKLRNQHKGQQIVNLLSSLSKRLAELFQRPVEGYRVASLLSLPV